MLRRYRRYWSVIIGLMLFTPMIVGLVAPDDDTMFKDELRQRATAPAFPRNLAELRGLPVAIDRFLLDNFGLRAAMIHAHAMVEHLWLGSGNAFVQVAREGRMFYRNDRAQEQSAGVILREAQIAETADVVADIAATLRARGVRFLFASPPNEATIYQDYLPQWARRGARATEYDALLAALKERGVPAVDLRPALLAARATEPVYLKYDTHWTARGALVGFNEIAAAAGHPDWRLTPAEALGPPEKVTHGDLARTLGLTRDLTETAESLALPAPPEDVVERAAYPTFRTRPGSGDAPAIMIIGDSFTMSFHRFARAGRFFWTFHRRCAVDWKWIDEFRPDEVWWLPTERFMLCDPGARPKGMPAANAAGG